MQLVNVGSTSLSNLSNVPCELQFMPSTKWWMDGWMPKDEMQEWNANINKMSSIICNVRIIPTTTTEVALITSTQENWQPFFHFFIAWNRLLQCYVNLRVNYRHKRVKLVRLYHYGYLRFINHRHSQRLSKRNNGEELENFNPQTDNDRKRERELHPNISSNKALSQSRIIIHLR